MNNERYTKQEDEYLKIWYTSIGAKECSKYLNRSVPSIQYRAHRLGLYIKTRRCTSNVRWTKEEDAILYANYESYGYEKCVELLPHRTKDAIINRAHILKLRYLPKWSEEERKIVYTYYPLGGAILCRQHLPDKSIVAIRAWATDHGVKYNGKFCTWSEEEKEVIRQYYPTDPKRCYEILNRDKRSVMRQAESMGVRSKYFYTPEEDQILIDNYKTLGPSGCAALLKRRSLGSVFNRAKILGLRKYDKKED